MAAFNYANGVSLFMERARAEEREQKRAHHLEHNQSMFAVCFSGQLRRADHERRGQERHHLVAQLPAALPQPLAVSLRVPGSRQGARAAHVQGVQPVPRGRR